MVKTVKKPKVADPPKEKKPLSVNGPGVLPDEAREALRDAPPAATTAELEDRAKDRTKGGRVSKTAKDAQAQLDMIDLIRPTIGAINEIAASRWPEFRHSEDELKAITLAGSKVLVKYVDNAMTQYQDEIILAVVLGGTLLDKGIRYRVRVAKEKKEKPPKIQQGRPVQETAEAVAKGFHQAATEVQAVPDSVTIDKSKWEGMVDA